MKFIIRVIIILILAVVLYGVGDYLNMPLWPTDFLQPSLPVEFSVESENFSDGFKEFLQESKGTVVLSNELGVEFQRLTTDANGIARTVLRVGTYQIRAFASGIRNDSWIYLSTQNGISGVPVNIAKGNQSILLPVVSRPDVSQQEISRQFSEYMQRGDWDSGLILARGLGIEERKDAQQLLDFRIEYEALTVDSYNSKIVILESILEILKKYSINKQGFIYLSFSRQFDIESRLEAIRVSRNKVIESFVEIMDEFAASGRLEAVFEEWQQLRYNPELYSEDPAERTGFSQDLDRYGDMTSAIFEELTANIQVSFDTAVGLYESGDLNTARTQFTRLMSNLRNLQLNRDFPEMESEIRTYLDDIALIILANNAIRDDRLEYALEIFDIVVNSNALVKRRIRETNEFLRFRSKPAEGVQY